MGGRPGAWNLLGLLPVVAGIGILVWDCIAGFARAPEIPKHVEGLGPPVLLTRGPHAFTRNPMYLAELALWSGWTILYGSAAVALGLVILAAGIVAVVPREERALEARFGAAYRQYKSAVPRWLGTVRR